VADIIEIQCKNPNSGLHALFSGNPVRVRVRVRVRVCVCVCGGSGSSLYEVTHWFVDSGFDPSISPS